MRLNEMRKNGSTTRTRAGAVMMAWDFFVKAGPMLPRFLNVDRYSKGPAGTPAE